MLIVLFALNNFVNYVNNYSPPNIFKGYALMGGTRIIIVNKNQFLLLNYYKDQFKQIKNVL